MKPNKGKPDLTKEPLDIKNTKLDNRTSFLEIEDVDSVLEPNFYKGPKWNSQPWVSIPVKHEWDTDEELEEWEELEEEEKDFRHIMNLKIEIGGLVQGKDSSKTIKEDSPSEEWEEEETKTPTKVNFDYEGIQPYNPSSEGNNESKTEESSSEGNNESKT